MATGQDTRRGGPEPAAGGDEAPHFPPLTPPPNAVKLRPAPAPAGTPDTYVRRYQELISHASIAAMWVTPAMAREWLERYNTHNRKLSHYISRRLRDKISADLWYANGESVVFDWNGVLLNGQHRLDAIATGKVAVCVLVVFGISPGAFATYDQGKTRTGSDVLGMVGHSNCTILASALGWAISDDEREGADDLRKLDRLAIPNEKIHELVDAYPGLVESVYYASARKSRLAPYGLLAYLHWSFHNHAPDHAPDFFKKVIEGVNVTKPSWEHSLRARLDGDLLGRRTGPDQVMIAALFIKAFNRVLFQEPCTTFTRNGKEFQPFLVWKPGPEHFPRLKPGPFPPCEGAA